MFSRLEKIGAIQVVAFNFRQGPIRLPRFLAWRRTYPSGAGFIHVVFKSSFKLTRICSAMLVQADLLRAARVGGG